MNKLLIMLGLMLICMPLVVAVMDSEQVWLTSQPFWMRLFKVMGKSEVNIGDTSKIYVVNTNICDKASRVRLDIIEPDGDFRVLYGSLDHCCIVGAYYSVFSIKFNEPGRWLLSASIECEKDGVKEWTPDPLNLDVIVNDKFVCTDGEIKQQYVTNYYCKNNNVYVTIKRQVCEDNKWVTEEYQSMVANCVAEDKICQVVGSKARCVVPPECQNDQDCGGTYYTGAPFCKKNVLYRTKVVNKCDNGKCDSYTVDEIKEVCSNGCEAGACLSPPESECVVDADCGETIYTGNRFCVGNDVYEDVILYKCIDGHCATEETTEPIETCDYKCVEGYCTDMDGSEEGNELKLIFILSGVLIFIIFVVGIPAWKLLNRR